MYDVLEQVDNFLSEPIETDDGQEIFDRLVDFIMNLKPDSLSDDQIEEVMDILDQLKIEDEITEQQKRVPKLANKTPMEKRQYSRKYTRQNRVKIKKTRIKLKRSSDGRKRKRLKPNMGRKFKTPTGRDKTRYHPTRGGQGGKREKKENGKK
jgi:hypothetical protein